MRFVDDDEVGLGNPAPSAHRLMGEERDGRTKASGHVGPLRQQRCWYEGGRLAIQGADGEGDVRFAKSDGIGEQRTTKHIETACNAAGRIGLVRQEPVGSFPVFVGAPACCALEDLLDQSGITAASALQFELQRFSNDAQVLSCDEP